jgi:hypothetical protein
MAIRTVDLLHVITISVIRALGRESMSSERLNLNCDSCLMDECIQTGIHIVRTVESIFPYLNLEGEFEADRSLRVVQTGC